MSGDGAGIVVGGFILLGTLPYIIGGALVIGAAAGAVKVGSMLVKSGSEHIRSAHEANEQQKQLEVQQCSAELAQLYKEMQRLTDDQRSQYDRQRIELGSHLQRSGQALQQMVSKAHPTKASARMAEAEHQAVEQQLQQITAEQREEIRQKAKTMSQTIISNLQIAKETQSALVNWKVKTADAIAMQRAQSQILLRDAIASAKLLGSLSKSYSDPDFNEKAKRLIENAQKARRYFEQEMYELCAAESQNVVTQTARLALDKTQQDLERDELRTTLLAKLEGLRENMACCRYIDFVDDYADRKATEDLNDYCQGEYVKLQQLLEQRIAQANAVEAPLTLLEQMEDECDNILAVNVNTICEAARNQLLSHYEKLRMMEIIADFMKDQNYDLEWACNPGDDPSQKLSVRFVNRASNNSVVLTLDKDTDPEQVGRMLMDMHIFYDNNRPMTESEKQTLRKHLVEALNKAGLSGSLSCSGSVNSPSAHTEMIDQEQVRNQETVPLFDQ